MEWISVKDRLPEYGQSVALVNIDRWENCVNMEHSGTEGNVPGCVYPLASPARSA